jgi:hypothetical protein
MFSPVVKGITITNTTTDSLTIQSTVDLNNPTDYSASVPYADVYVFCNGSYVGNVTATKLTIKHGVNSNITVSATWSPKGLEAKSIGRELLSQWISGKYSYL